ncbi:MAG: preprotein translocase subunit SecG, partial [Clostridia bacterium]
MGTWLIVINVVLILVAIVLIISVLMQEGNRAGLGAIGGGAETFFGKSKAKGVQGKLQLITKICAIAFIILALAGTILAARLNKTVNDLQTPVVTEDTLAVDATEVPEAAVATPAAPEAVATPAAPEAAAATPVAPEAPAATPEAAPEAAAATPVAPEAPAATPAAVPQA